MRICSPSVPSLLRRHWSRFAVLVGGNEGKGGFRHLVADIVGAAPPPSLDSDRHRCSSDSLDAAIEADFVTDKNRPMKNHAIHGHGRATAAAPSTCGVSRREVHLRHQPAAEDISGGISICGHGNRADQRFPCIWVSRIGHNFLQNGKPKIRKVDLRCQRPA
jgi:hypothetical protein